jgi:hypothetical protein
MRFFGHLKTVAKHRFCVLKHCFRCGLYWQGLTHDLSKFSPAEFWPGVKYYQGNRSPQVKEREFFGYSAAWLHHKGRNKHHFEYWVDSKDRQPYYVQMPAKYFGEMVCDRIAASKIYLKDKYTDAAPLAYYNERTNVNGMNPKTAEDLFYFLKLLNDEGEQVMFATLKKWIKNEKKSQKNLK